MQKNGSKHQKRILILTASIILVVFLIYSILMYMAGNAAREFGKTINCRESTFIHDDSVSKEKFKEYIRNQKKN